MLPLIYIPTFPPLNIKKQPSAVNREPKKTFVCVVFYILIICWGVIWGFIWGFKMCMFYYLIFFQLYRPLLYHCQKTA